MKMLKNRLLALVVLCSAVAFTSDAWALSLAKTTVNNVSGSYTPNALLVGYFDLYVTGNVTINAPTNCLDSQIIAISTTMANGSQPLLTWDSAYAYGDRYVWSGTGPQGTAFLHLFICNAGVYALVSVVQTA